MASQSVNYFPLKYPLVGMYFYHHVQKQIERAKAAGHNIIQVKTTGDPVETAQIIQETRKLLSDSDTLLIDPNTSQ